MIDGLKVDSVKYSLCNYDSHGFFCRVSPNLYIWFQNEGFMRIAKLHGRP